MIEHWGGRLAATIVFVVLARLLQPAEFGLVALATVFIVFLNIFQDQGLGNAIIQRKDLEPQHLDTAFWFGLGSGCVLMLAMLMSAGAISAVLREPGLAGVLRGLSVTFVLAGANTTQIAILRRRMDFRPLAIRTLIGTVVGGGIGIAMALYGLGVWALVGQYTAQRAVQVVALWSVTAWRPRLRFSWTHLGDLLGFGVAVTGHSVLNFLNQRSDDFLIGAFLGPVALGFYTVAYRLLTLLTELFARTLSDVTLPAFSQVQGNHARARQGLYSATRMSSRIAFPSVFGVAAVAPDLVTVVFGSQWQLAVPVMRILALGGVLNVFIWLNGSVIVAEGKPAWVLRLSAANAVLNVTAFAIALRWGIVGVATAFAVRAYVTAPLAPLVLRRLIGLDLGRYAHQILPAALLSLVMAALVVAATVAAPAQVGAGGRLLIGGGIGLVTYAVLLWVFSRQLVYEAAGNLRSLSTIGRT